MRHYRPVFTHRQCFAQPLRRRGRSGAAAFALFALVMLTACADADTERRFANEDVTATDPGFLPPTITPAIATAAPTRPPATPRPIADLLSGAGARRQFFVADGDRLLSFADPTALPVIIWQGNGETILDVAASREGDRVAIVVAGDAGKAPALVLLEADGDERRRIDRLDAVAPSAGATPTAEAGHLSIQLSWSPAGDQLLLALPQGGIALVPIEGELTLLLPPARANVVRQVDWSPSGEAFAFVAAQEPGGAAGLYVAALGPPPLDPVRLVEPSGDGRREVRDVAWLPNGEELLFAQGTTVGLVQGGDLFLVRAAGGSPRLVAAAGRVAPVSSVDNFAPSPDGRAVAFTVVVPGDDGRLTESLWVQEIDAPFFVSLAIPAGQVVTDLWWTGDGLMWTSVPGDADLHGSGPIAISLAAPDGAVSIVYQREATTATPVASPAGSPPASPAAAASPAATPASASEP